MLGWSHGSPRWTGSRVLLVWWCRWELFLFLLLSSALGSASLPLISPSSRHLTSTTSSLATSFTLAYSDLPFSLGRIAKTKASSPSCFPAATRIALPACTPGLNSTSSSSKCLVCRTLPSPSAYSFFSLARGSSPGLFTRGRCPDPAWASGLGWAPRPSLLGRERNSTTLMSSFAFLPTPLPSSQPIPRSMASPKCATGIRA
mmetsp:Transcript_12984/g.32661  ORF Transcript_12984/g.32661 Transcript_12984/m.32661 type:complete len:202 (+) Transcript_12984:316-921(+)